MSDEPSSASPSSAAAGSASALRERTLARFDELRQAWRSNEAVRALYGRWYERVRAALPPQGPWIEIGSGPGFARQFIPELQLTDVVRAPWHDGEADATALPFADGSAGALVLFDVLHHIATPAQFFAEAARVLRPGGRIVLCEPYISPLSWPVYRFLHHEALDMRVDPLAGAAAGPSLAAKDPFAANQAIPTLIFGRARAQLERRFPLRVERVERLAGPSYPMSGGLSRGPLLPLRLWQLLLAVEDRLPEAAFRVLGFRLFAAVRRTAVQIAA